MALDSWRETYRAEQVPRGYRGRLHLVLTTAVALGVAVFAVSRVHGPTIAELLTAPIAFLLANGAEYVGHRFPMHHRYRGLERVFHRHAATHHRFFTFDDMLGRDDRDWHVTLFPPVLLAFFFLGIGAPLAAVTFFLFGSNPGWIFVVVSSSYFVIYEWLHLSYHVAPTSWLHRVPGVAALSRHHRVHHDPRRMARCNFNISFPIFDVLMGTRARD